MRIFLVHVSDQRVTPLMSERTQGVNFQSSQMCAAILMRDCTEKDCTMLVGV